MCVRHVKVLIRLTSRAGREDFIEDLREENDQRQEELAAARRCLFRLDFGLERSKRVSKGLVKASIF